MYRPPEPAGNSPAQPSRVRSPPERADAGRAARLRQHRFRTVFRGFDKTEVVALLTEARGRLRARAARESIGCARTCIRIEALLTEHREREANLRNTLLTAQRLADEIKEAAQNEAKLIVQGSDRGARTCCSRRRRCRLEEVERDINEMRLRRRGVEGHARGLDPGALSRARVHSRTGQPDDKVLLHRPRQTGTGNHSRRLGADAPRVAEDRD